MTTLDEIARYLDRILLAEAFGAERGGVWRPSARRVRRMGLALEPSPGLGAWAARETLDALFLHRPWRLDERSLDDRGVVASHLPFDERLTTGYNPRLAEVLGMRGLRAIGEKRGRPLGMVGAVTPEDGDRVIAAICETFGGAERAIAPAGIEAVTRVAVVGAMTDALVREAAGRGADIYVTGQWRIPGASAVEETGIGVVAVGHRRCEEWGLRALAAAIGERWAGLACLVAPE